MVLVKLSQSDLKDGSSLKQGVEVRAVQLFVSWASPVSRELTGLGEECEDMLKKMRQ